MGGAFRVIGGDDAGLYFRHTDHLGSTSVLSDSDGLKIEGSEVVYAPFGEIREGEQSNLTDFGFTGQRLDSSTGGLTFYQSRYYLPGLKRFISPDTIVPGAANPQAFNRYSYVLNNPLKFIDPTGHVSYLDDMWFGWDWEGWDWTPAPAPPAPEPEPVSYLDDMWFGGGDDDGSDGGISNVTALGLGRPSGTAQLEEIQIAADSFSAFMEFHALGIDCEANGGMSAGGLIGIFEFTASMCGSHNGQVPEAEGKPPCSNPLSSRCRREAERALEDPCANVACFDAETLVSTQAGMVPIEALEEGDYVLAYDEETGEVGYYPIEAVLAHLDPVIVYLTIDGEVIETTPEHPFYTADGEWIEAGSLLSGDEILQADGTTGIVQTTVRVSDPRIMYNLSVEEAHTFFVGEGQWLVHNNCDYWATHPEDFEQYTDELPPNNGPRSGAAGQYDEATGELKRVGFYDHNGDLILRVDQTSSGDWHYHDLSASPGFPESGMHQSVPIGDQAALQEFMAEHGFTFDNWQSYTPSN